MARPSALVFRMSWLTDQLACLPSWLLPQHTASRVVYHLARSRRPWLKQALIDGLIRAYRIDLSDAAEPDPRAYPDFVSFFTRALRDGARPTEGDEHALVSPADGTLSAFGAIAGDTLVQAKGRTFTTAELLGGDFALADEFTDGAFATVYLAPRDYHRVHMPLAGTLRSMTQPGGEFSKALSVGDVQNEPGYQFGMQQGLTGTARQLAKMQGRNGGATLKALTRFGTDYGATKYNDAWNRANADRGFRYNALANLSGTGQQAVNQITSTGMNAANNAGNLTTSGGAARAAGLVGSANAIGNGITGAGNSLLQYQMFNKLFPNDGTAGNIAKGNALMAGYGGGQDIYSF